MDWLFEADRDAERRFPWISIPGVASIVYWVKSLFGTTLVRIIFAMLVQLLASHRLQPWQGSRWGLLQPIEAIVRR